jgi:hypothetical protein
VANTPDVTEPTLTVGPITDDLQPMNPFLALRYQFGMLLGVDDFETAQAYARGKMRLHNAWLHGAGVVWGFGVSAPPVSATDATLRGEIQVDPGLALDGHGRELHLDAAACVNVGAWYDKHKDDEGFVHAATDTGGVSFAAHIELRFRACLTRPVPAMTEPCDGGSNGTAFSRAFETVEVKLVPGPAPARTNPYHRLRLLFGVEGLTGATATPAEQGVLDELSAIAGAAAADRGAAFLAAFRRCAALDVIDLAPGKSADGTRTLLFPGAEDAPVVLADLTGVTLDPVAGGGWTLRAVTIDPTVRPAHVATATIEELNCCAGAATGVDGPWIDADSVQVDDGVVTLKATRPLAAASVAPAAFAFVRFDQTAGWSALTIEKATLDATDKLTVKLAFTPATPPTGLLRLIVRGTGTAPVLGDDLIPLGARAGASDGKDFVHMWNTRS